MRNSFQPPASVALLAAALLVLAGCSEQAGPTTPPEASFGNHPSIPITLGGCDFESDGTSTLELVDDCTTDVTIAVPDGYTLDGKGHTITAVDPAGGHFVGAVVRNAGTTASITHLNVTADGLTNTCDSGVDRLRGILLEGASGAITHNSVVGINQGPSGCQEGNGIEVRNEPFDGTHPNTQTVEIAHNTVSDYQKTGIIAIGDLEFSIQHNDVGESATQENLAANSVQVGYGASGSVVQNRIDGNQWKGTSNYVATAVLVLNTSGVDINKNNIGGNSGTGIYLSLADDGLVKNNRVRDEGADHPNSIYDFGIINFGADNVVTNNKVRGFDNPFYGTIEDDNKIIPSPNS